jgi:hypothetical protein
MVTIADLPTIMGAILILTGIGLLSYQMVKRPPPAEQQLVAKFGATGWNFDTVYPGIVVILAGVLLLIFAHR